jgi:choline dehydrogenase
MGADNDPMAVLDDRLKVRGCEGRRVIDASMMPNTISGNTNAVLAVADKAAVIMLGSRS